MSVPTNFRSEAVSPSVVVLRWTNNSLAGSIEIYRSTDGSSYTLLDTVPGSDERYQDTSLSEKTRYWYKATDDGLTFTSITNVTTHIEAPDAGIINSTPLAIQSNDPAGMYQELAQQIQALEAKNTLSKTPCDVCLVNGAIVLDCSKGCNWFRVVMDSDINSISVIGCEECPPCDFIIPPGETFSICGWPVGCEYTWDECFDAPLTGGTGGRTGKTNGLSYGGYGSPGDGAGPKTQCCECPSVERIGAGDYLRIVCCEDDGDCAMSCGESFRIKACGGLGPYTWSKTGNVSLSSTSGACITVTSTASGTSGGGGTNPAYCYPTIRYLYYGCPNQQVCDILCGEDHKLSVGIAVTVKASCYDCSGNHIGSHFVDSAQTPVGNSTNSSLELTGFTCDVQAGGNPAWYWQPTEGVCYPNSSTPPSAELTITAAPAGQTAFSQTVHGSAAAYSGTVTLPYLGTLNNLNGCVGNDIFEFGEWRDDGVIDIRSQASIDAGCLTSNCSQGTSTVTVTDAAGVSATLILA